MDFPSDFPTLYRLPICVLSFNEIPVITENTYGIIYVKKTLIIHFF